MLGKNSVTESTIIEETESTSESRDITEVSVTEISAPLDGQGVEETDYGTMAAAAKGDGKRSSMKRPAYLRQETSESLFKDPIWGKKGGDE